MKIPETVKVGALVWTIREDKIASDAGSMWGYTHCETQTITFDTGLTQQHREQILLHELLHTAIWQTGLRPLFNEGKVITEEECVQQLTPVLHAILKENRLHFDE